ncbi:MAG TPA: CoA-binding protein [Dehalococcoidales bacterium]|nr:CoA-binding protein [Dehalococcoidales bacterium]
MDSEKILRECKVVAVVGASPDTEKASNRIFNYLKQHGYKVIPVNPNADKIGDNVCYPSLVAVPEKVDVVDIFRRSEDCDSVVQEAIDIGAKAVWMQEGIVNEKAAEKARRAGLMVVMDHCIMKEHRKMNSV